MKELKINNQIILLDDEDYESISKMSGWYIHKPQNSRTLYVQHDKFGKLHRYILNITNPTLVVDHIDRNGLNNQKSNLRITNNTINKRNQNTCSNNSFNFNGISFEKPARGRAGRIIATWSEYEYLKERKRNKTRCKRFSLSKYSMNEALRLGVLIRIEKMREFDYLIDERSETIEKEIRNNPNANMEEILGIKFSNILE